jgi:tetratricopeptide (TPR) repeat protein
MRTALLVTSVVSILCMSAVAGAEPTKYTDVNQEARTSFHRGVQLYNEGSIEAALAEFNKAYQLSPNYRLLYNIAQTQFDLHDYVAASRSLERYLTEGGSELADDRRMQVAEMNRKLEERIGRLEIVCNMDGAEIRVDDLPVGESPLPSPIPVNAGRRRITAIKSGHPTAARLVTAPGMETTRVFLEIVPAPAPDPVAGPVATPSKNETKDDTSDIADQKGASKKMPSRAGFITSAVLTGSCAVATGAFAVLALQARNDFDQELKTVPNSADNIDHARSRAKLYARATDAFGAATLISAGLAMYFLLTDSTEPDAQASPERSLTVAPTVGGLVVHGRW